MKIGGHYISSPMEKSFLYSPIHPPGGHHQSLLVHSVQLHEAKKMKPEVETSPVPQCKRPGWDFCSVTEVVL
jgi:hypothetical protein